jgi:hypothetical protein
MPDLVKDGEEVIDWLKAQMPLAELAASYDLCR